MPLTRSTAGLDAPTRELVLSLLEHLHTSPNPPHIILGVRLQDPLPEWTTHLAFVRKNGRIETGKKEDILRANPSVFGHHLNASVTPTHQLKHDGHQDEAALVDLDGVSVTYGDREVSLERDRCVHVQLNNLRF